MIYTYNIITIEYFTTFSSFESSRIHPLELHKDNLIFNHRYFKITNQITNYTLPLFINSTHIHTLHRVKGPLYSRLYNMGRKNIDDKVTHIFI
jgi:hypothetical protein